MSYFMLLLVAVAPVVAVPLLFGGVRLTDLLAGLGMVLLTSVMLGSVGIWASSRARSSRGAVASAYTWSFVLAFITLAAMAGELLLLYDGSAFPAQGREIVSILPNPYVGMASAVVHPLGSDGLSGTPFDIVEVLLLQRQGFEGFGFGMDIGVDAARALPLRRPPVWAYTIGIYVISIVVALAGATRRVRAPATRIRSLRRSNGT